MANVRLMCVAQKCPCFTLPIIMHTRPEWLINPPPPPEAGRSWIAMHFHTLTKATFPFTVFNQPLRLTSILWVSITTFMISCSTGTWSEVWHKSQTTLTKKIPPPATRHTTIPLAAQGPDHNFDTEVRPLPQNNSFPPHPNLPRKTLPYSA